MYNGKYTPRKRRLRWKREFVLVMSVALLILGVVGGSLAYLFTSTEDVVNTFTPADVTPTINEDFDGDVKSNVTVTNSGNTDAYIRAAVVITWVDEAGNVVANAEGHTYECNYNLTADGWFVGEDGFYYYSKPVAAKNSTGVLINSARVTAGTEYQLNIEIMAQTIQAVPASVVENAWGVTVADNGTISK